MCNTYIVRPKRGAKGMAQRASEATVRLKSELVRKSDPGVVVRADGRVDLMRWGFHRDFNPAINNAYTMRLLTRFRAGFLVLVQTGWIWRRRCMGGRTL